MTLSTPAGYSIGNLVYQEGFDGSALNSAWHKYITSKAANGSPWNSYNGGSGPGGQFEAEFDMPSQVSVHDGVLDITSSKTPIAGMNQGTVMTHPITSGTVSSYGNFEFNGGLLQVSMKQPVGNGAWPGIWLMPGSGASNGDNFEIDIQEGGYTGKGPANQAFQWHLHTPSGEVGGVVDTGIDLTADFHTYAIDWKPGQSITWYLDGKQMAQVTSAQLPIPNQPMELILDSQWANSKAAGWHSTVDGSTPQTSHMLVDGVQLYQNGSNQSVKGGNVTAGSTPSNSGPVQPVNIAPTVSGVTAQPGAGTSHVGDKVALTLGFSEAVNVTGKPTLTLNDGSVANYVSGSGTNKLVFSTTVATTDKSTSVLGITGVNLASGSSIKDAGGLAADLSGVAKTFAGLGVDTSAVTTPVTKPPANTAPSVTGVSAQPGAGVEHVGDKIALTVAFDEAVTVNGKPRLTLNDGSVASYVSGSGTGKLLFSTTVAATDKSVAALGVTSLNLANGATIKDSAGLAANLSGTVKSFAGLSVDNSPTVTSPGSSTPTKPVVTIADNSLSVSPGGKIDLGIHVSTTDKNDAVSINIKGLPKYETIVDGLGHVHRTDNITLSAAEVDSGLTLKSNYKGTDSPMATLSVNATGRDPLTGNSATSAVQTIAVLDPPVAGGSNPSRGNADSGGHSHDQHDKSFALLSQAMAGGLQSRPDLGAIASAAVSHVSSWLNESILTRPH